MGTTDEDYRLPITDLRIRTTSKYFVVVPLPLFRGEGWDGVSFTTRSFPSTTPNKKEPKIFPAL